MSNAQKALAGKVALVTGGSSGIGYATALLFAEGGASVVIADVNEKGSAEIVNQIKWKGGDARFVRADVSRDVDNEAMVQFAVSNFGRLDYAFNNAGVEGVQSPTADYTMDAWNRVLAVNLTGVWLGMKYELRQMVRQKSGAIVNNASILGNVGFANASAYCASKHGILGLTKTAALEYAPFGIRINAVCPGFIETPMLERAGIREKTPLYEAMANLHPMKRLGKSEEVADAVVWLCTHGSFVTGHPMLVDGGYVAQ